MDKKTVNLTIRISEDLKSELEAAAQADDRPAASLIRRFIRAGLEEQHKQSKVSHTDALQGVA